ncbi:MAG: hypothetical protein MUF42_14145 [Cytophagaceae bacterium]|jgi:hypothetical protein|nr:hypothetical protein [Cytophagaceae bacterium]
MKNIFKQDKSVSFWFSYSFRFSLLFFLSLLMVNYLAQGNFQAQHFTQFASPGEHQIWCVDPSCLVPESVKALFRLDWLWR